MKIFYAVQATGNGHISRAMELLPYLLQYGTVDLMLSGSNSSLSLNGPVKFRSKGLSLFYNCRGGLDYFSIIRHFNPVQIRQQAKDLPVEKYDLIINDFDYITATACARKKVPSIHFGHQASFASPKVPRPPKQNAAGEWILKNYAKCTYNVGLHFQRYDSFVFTPVIKKEILEAEPVNRNFITVYLPSFCEPELLEIFGRLRDVHFEIFSKEATSIRNAGNITFLPVEKDLFNKSLIQCSGIITGAGFETPAEALHLGKRLMCIPIKGQYEQACNAAALSQMGVCCLESIESDFGLHFYKWLNQKPVQVNYGNSIPEALSYLLLLHESYYYQESTQLQS